MTRRLAFVLALLFPAVAFPQFTCPVSIGGPVRSDIAGWILPNVTDIHGDPATAVTVIDVSHPAIVPVDATRLTFKYGFVDSQPAQITVAAMRAAGDEYRVADAAAPFVITPQGPPSPVQPELRTITLPRPLHFEPGDMLAIEAKPAAGGTPGLITTASASPQGVLALAMEIGGPTMHPFPFVNPLASQDIAASVQGQGVCDFPITELLLPVVGALDGVVHYSTEISASIGPLYPGGPSFNWSLRDRLRDPNTATIVKGTSPTVPQNGIGMVTGLPSSYLGSMIIETGYPHPTGPGGRWPFDWMKATAKINAASIDAVSCEALAHTIVLPFHLAPGQRLNIGVASADLHSCGIVVPANSVLVNLGGRLPLTVAMPAGSIQLNDVTGAKAPLPGAEGITDGFIYVTVTDEASRVVAYSSIVDGAAQTIAYGTTIR